MSSDSKRNVGDRPRRSARELWHEIPVAYRRRATSETGGWELDKGSIPAALYRVCDKAPGHRGVIERSDHTLEQRLSRLSRETLSFSKSLHNHLCAIKYFTSHYNPHPSLQAETYLLNLARRW